MPGSCSSNGQQLPVTSTCPLVWSVTLNFRSLDSQVANVVCILYESFRLHLGTASPPQTATDSAVQRQEEHISGKIQVYLNERYVRILIPRRALPNGQEYIRKTIYTQVRTS